jgi:hypothetical protein
MAKKNAEATTTAVTVAAEALQPDPQALAGVNTSLAEVKPYEGFAVNNATDCSEALAVIDKCKDAISAIDRIFDEPTGLAHKLWKSLTTRRAALKSPFETLKLNMEARIRGWRQRIEAEEKARQEAERKRLEEAQRIEQELQAMLLDMGGEPEVADAVISAPVVVPPVVLAEQMPDGLATRDNWKAVVDDLMELCKGIAEGKVPLVAVVANKPYLNQQARQHKKALKDLIPGVHAVNKEVIL